MRTVLAAAVLASSLGAGVLHAAPPPRQEPPASAERDSEQPLKDAYLRGRIESAFALNPNVSAYDIDVKVENGVAYLAGSVDSDTERDLAVELARGVDEVREVRSGLSVDPDTRSRAEKDRRRTVGQTLDDAGTTASIKAKLLANRSIGGSAIDVTTREGIVTLTGKVGSEAEKDLAGRIAENNSDALEVRNQLTVSRR